MRTLLIAGLLLIGAATFAQSKVYVVYADTVLDIADVDSAIIEVAFPVNPDSGVIFSNGWREGYQAAIVECDTNSIVQILAKISLIESRDIAAQYEASRLTLESLARLEADIMRYNAPIIRTSLSASALATLVQSFPAGTVIVVQSRTASGTTNITYKTQDR